MSELFSNCDFACDGVHCYARGKRILHADAVTFRIVEGSYFAYDSKHLYAVNSYSREGLMIMDGFDTSALFWVRLHNDAGGLEPIDHFSTLHDLYEFNGHFIERANKHKFQHIPGPDHPLPFGARPYSRIRDALLADYPNTVGWWHPDYPWHRLAEEVCGASLESGYYSSGGSSFYLEKIGCELIPHYLPLLSVELRQDLNAYYAKTETQVYYKYRPIDADSASFTVIDGEFARDDQHAFFNGYRVEGADPETLRPRWLPARHNEQYRLVHYAYCRRAAYVIKTPRLGKYQGYDRQLLPIPGADPESFEVLSYAWAKDRYRVYEDGNPKDGRCATDFRVIASLGPHLWATDSHGLYNENGRRVVKGAESGNFEALNNYWLSNGRQVFSLLTEKLMPSIDAASFEILDDKTAQDLNHIYTVRPHAWGYEEIHKQRRKR